MLRGLHERIYLLGCSSKKKKDLLEWELSVCGASGSTQKIKLTNKLSCSCPDHRFKRQTCKHMYFTLYRVCCFPHDKFFDPGKIEKAQLEEINAALLTKFTTEGERVKVVIDKFDPDECCCICYEELGVEEDIVACGTTCKNCFHAACVEMWRKASSNCPMCRTDPLESTPVDTSNFKNEEENKEGEENADITNKRKAENHDDNNENLKKVKL